MSLREPPYRLCCGQQHWGPVCPDGLVMCCMCFKRVSKDELLVEADGIKVDVCLDCARVEEMMMRIAAI